MPPRGCGHQVMNMDVIILKMNFLMMMDEDDVIDTNDEDEINRLIQDTFSPLDEDNLHDIHGVRLLKKSENLFMKAQQKIFYLLYCCW